MRSLTTRGPASWLLTKVAIAKLYIEEMTTLPSLGCPYAYIAPSGMQCFFFALFLWWWKREAWHPCFARCIQWRTVDRSYRTWVNSQSPEILLSLTSISDLSRGRMATVSSSTPSLFGSKNHGPFTNPQSAVTKTGCIMVPVISS